MSKLTYQIDQVFETTLEHGEGPFWDEVRQEYFWVDLLQGIYYRGSTETGHLKKQAVGQPLGVMALREQGGQVMAVRDGFGFFDEESLQLELIQPSPEQDNREVRFNDGVVSPQGQFWAGTMEWDGKKKIGKLFRLNTDHSFTTLETDLFIPNGMGWNTKVDTFFMIDTGQHCVFAYDYDLQNDGITNRRVFIQFEDNENPDGMAIDAQDHFWIAMWGGAKIIHLDQDGNKVEEILLPVPFPTSCCFGGGNLDQLFITSSRITMNQDQIDQYPLSGTSFVIPTNRKGKPGYRFAG